MRSEYIDVAQPVSELVNLVYNHFGKTPMGWTEIDKLTEYAHDSMFVDVVFRLYDYINKNPSTILDINSSQIYKIIYKFQLASKSLMYNPKQIADCYLFLANYAVKLYNHVYHIIDTNKHKLVFSKIKDSGDQRKLGLFSALLRAYAETLYCDEHTISEEIVSPIVTDDDELIIYKKFINLSAYNLYNEAQECPYKSIEIFFKYDSSVEKPEVDIVGNLQVTSNILRKLNGYFIEIVDNSGAIIRIDSLSKIEEISVYFERTMRTIISCFKRKPLIERLQCKILSEYYALKPYFDIEGKEWKPHLEHLSISDITSIEKPVVRANYELAAITDEEAFLAQLFKLNNPLVHWDC